VYHHAKFDADRWHRRRDSLSVPGEQKKQKPNLVSGIKHTSVASARQKYTANLLIRRYSAWWVKMNNYRISENQLFHFVLPQMGPFLYTPTQLSYRFMLFC